MKDKIIKKDNKEKLITIEELSEISKVKLNIISRYVKQKLLFYEQKNNSYKRYYDETKTLKRLSIIKELEKEGFTVKEMLEFFSKEDRRSILKEIK